MLPLVFTSYLLFVVICIPYTHSFTQNSIQKIDAHGGGTMNNNGAPHLFFRRLTTAADQDVIWQLLSYAAHEPSVEATKSQECCIPYAQDFGTRRGDFGILATAHENNKNNKELVLGGAWIRLLGTQGMATAYNHHIQNDIPELAMAVIPNYRGKGIGSKLLTRFLTVAKQNGIQQINLSCRTDNEAAMRLYERHGFTKIPSSEITNRVGGTNVSMTIKLM
jgi:GNAT superfamily N-acetyltransferase